jgi:hypothetical protein
MKIGVSSVWSIFNFAKRRELIYALFERVNNHNAKIAYTCLNEYCFEHI